MASTSVQASWAGPTGVLVLAEGTRLALRPKVADLAVAVCDELHNMGIGTALVTHTVQCARDKGFAFLTATTLWDNRPARALLRRFAFHPHASDGSAIELG